MAGDPLIQAAPVQKTEPGTFTAPHPGSAQMPRWGAGELIDAPSFTWRNWFALLGPGLLVGGSAIGGGEWLTGPAVTARYGGALLWLATFSILGQVIYNIEISRYTLYCGEPIFTGKFRTRPGPMFWLFMYLLLDFGAVFPYLAANAATPLAAVWLGAVPNPEDPSHRTLLKGLGYAIFLLALIPLVFGGKIYNSLKLLMTFKIVVVLGFLLMLGVLFSRSTTWADIFGGFVKFGSVPVQRDEDRNGNGVLDPGEDWDRDGRLDVVEPLLAPKIDTNGDGTRDAADVTGDGAPDSFIKIEKSAGKTVWWPDADQDGRPDASLRRNSHSATNADAVAVRADNDGKPFLDYDDDGKPDGDNLDNIFLSLFHGHGFPKVDLSMIAWVAAMVAIAGAGGLSNTPISNYTRDQGWGMGYHVGAIPSVVGGHNLQLSHVGTVFEVTSESLPRWRQWYRHVMRDQLVVWMPACFLGLALPSMLSVEFLPRRALHNDWTTAAMTADGVSEQVGGWLGPIFWYMTLFCGFLVLAPSMASAADGLIRRWVDVFWTASPMLRRLDPGKIRYVYFGVLIGYSVFGLTMLTVGDPGPLLTFATSIFNFALGFSCWHTVAINTLLLPRELRPGWFIRISMILAGAFFWVMGTLSLLRTLGWV